MSVGFYKYNNFDEEGLAYKDVYKEQRKAIPEVRKAHRTEPYYGDPPMTSTSHKQLMQPAANSANTNRMLV